MVTPSVLGDPCTDQATELMEAFARRTGITGAAPPRRYLWTDAFAVYNFVGLGRRDLAAALVDQVHRVLGQHRPDDARTGWISGLSESEGALRPTAGGLRIGKPEPERAAGEPLLEEREWDRDGQYFHYLTKWMTALARFARATSDPQPLLWARELAAAAFHAFADGSYMVWKRSIDLSRPLVGSMGQHDPLDGLVTCLELEQASRELRVPHAPTLDDAIAAFAKMVGRRSLVTTDPLGLGGLLLDAHRLASLPGAPPGLAAAIHAAAATGLDIYATSGELSRPASRRLAFRELGFAIGLRAADWHPTLVARIEAFWSRPEHRAQPTWTAHADINDVMFATCLCPDGVI